MQITKVTLQRGSEGPEVAHLQTILNLIGYYGDDIDGIFGLATEHGVKSYQADFGLKIDGIVGSSTWESLDNTIQELLAPVQGLKIPYTKVVIPWWLTAILVGVGIAGGIEAVSYFIKRRR